MASKSSMSLFESASRCSNATWTAFAATLASDLENLKASRSPLSKSQMLYPYQR
jgi:hypothetical protein